MKIKGESYSANAMIRHDGRVRSTLDWCVIRLIIAIKRYTGVNICVSPTSNIHLSNAWKTKLSKMSSNVHKIVKLWNYGKNCVACYDLHDRSILSRHRLGSTWWEYVKIPPISESGRLIMHSYVLQYSIYRIYAHTVPVSCNILVIIERKRRKIYWGTLDSRLQEAQFVFVYSNSLIYYTSPLGSMILATVHWPLQRLLLSSCIRNISVI